MGDEELCFTPAVELARLIRERALSPVECTQAVLRRMEACEERVNAYATVAAEAALAQARAAEDQVMRGEPLEPLHGVPYSVKDLLPVAGVRMGLGSRLMAREVPEEDAPAAARLRATGGIFLGKTCASEFGWKITGDCPLTGATRNPWNLEHTAGGSSGGAAAQIAAGEGPLALASDGAGSIRMPAAFTGVFGFKPTYGRVPVYPASFQDQLSHIGPMTRTVADAALMLRVISGPDPRDRTCLPNAGDDPEASLHAGVRGLRVAWSPHLGIAGPVDADVAARTAEAAAVFSELGAVVEEAHPAWSEDPTETIATLFTGALAGALGPRLAEGREQMDPGLLAAIEAGQRLTAADLVQAQARRHRLWQETWPFFARYDLLLTPASPVPAPRVGVLMPPGYETHAWNWFRWAPFAFPFNLLHVPAASVPAGFTGAGLPVGLQIAGPRFADALVLRAAAAYEAAHPWAQHRPPL